MATLHVAVARSSKSSVVRTCSYGSKKITLLQGQIFVNATSMEEVRDCTWYMYTVNTEHVLQLAIPYFEELWQ